MVALNFDARTVEPSIGYEPVPAGWYNVMVDDTEIRPTKKGDGSYLNIRFNILDGQHANQKVFHRLNLQNPNIATVEIAHKQLSAICHAVGIMLLQDSNELHGKPLKVRVKVRNDEEYGASNDVMAIKNINEPTPGSPTGTVAPGGPMVPTAPVAPPQGWGAGTVPAPTAPAAAPVVPVPAPAPAAPPERDPSYQYTADGKQRWKSPMTAWELVPEVAPPAAPATTGWTPPAATQPWAAPQPTPPAAPPTAPPPGATPPWMQPRS